MELYIKEDARIAMWKFSYLLMEQERSTWRWIHAFAGSLVAAEALSREFVQDGFGYNLKAYGAVAPRGSEYGALKEGDRLRRLKSLLLWLDKI